MMHPVVSIISLNIINRMILQLTRTVFRVSWELRLYMQFQRILVFKDLNIFQHRHVQNNCDAGKYYSRTVSQKLIERQTCASSSQMA